MKGFGYGVLGGFCTFLVYMFLGASLRAEDAKGAVVVGVIILCATLWGCTGVLVDNLKKISQGDKSE